MINSLIKDIYTLGSRMSEVLEAGDIDGFHALVLERGLLLDRLNVAFKASEVEALWSQWGPAFAEQYEVLQANLAEQERRMTEAATVLRRHSEARNTYQPAAVSGGILRGGLSG